MKYTLLELTQDVLSSLDSDEINSINDSVESQQVVKIIRSCYEELKDVANLPEHYSLVTLTASGDNTKPTLMTVPDDVSKVVWIKYNIETLTDTDMNYQTLTYLPSDQFLNRMYNLEESATNIGTFSHTFDGHTINILYQDDKHPEYYTTFNDHTILFDSYDSDVDTTLQTSKTSCYAKLVIPFTLSDNFTPDLDEAQFILLKNMAKSLAWAELKQTQHTYAERTSRRMLNRLGKRQVRVQGLSDFDSLPNFGRK